MPQPGEKVERVFREEYGRIIASLIRVSGSFELAEESLQEAFVSALATWERAGIPGNPAAWLTTVARRKLLDLLRREKIKSDKQSELEFETSRLQPADNSWQPGLNEEFEEYADERLRLIFTCCHPALSREAQVALTLRTLGGLSTTEIARAFILPEPTLAQRLVRAKQKIRNAGIPYEVPAREILSARLSSVQAVVYLIFNEGYSATAGKSLIREDLCSEAIRLGRLLCQLIPNEPENLGLLALMLLQDSRRGARINRDGGFVPLDEQDRSRWDRKAIDEGLALIAAALRLRKVGPYQLQAAIAALHAEAETAAETDWRQIVALYNELLRISPSPIVQLNKAAAVAMCDGAEKGLAQIDEAGSSGGLDDYYLFHASRADVLRRLNRADAAAAAYRRALELVPNQVEQDYIRRRLRELVSDKL
jgi:RNA polymerase sigma-70 factor (ECF subfamily)